MTQGMQIEKLEPQETPGLLRVSQLRVCVEGARMLFGG